MNPSSHTEKMSQAQTDMIDQDVELFRNKYLIPQHPRSEDLTNNDFNVIMKSFEVDPDNDIWRIYHDNFNSIRTHHFESAWRGANSVSFIREGSDII